MLVTRVFLRSVRPCIPHADSKSVQKQSINQLIEKMRTLVDFGLSLTAHLLAIVDGFLTSMVTWSCLDRLCKKILKRCRCKFIQNCYNELLISIWLVCFFSRCFDRQTNRSQTVYFFLIFGMLHLASM